MTTDKINQISVAPNRIIHIHVDPLIQRAPSDCLVIHAIHCFRHASAKPGGTDRKICQLSDCKLAISGVCAPYEIRGEASYNNL